MAAHSERETQKVLLSMNRVAEALTHLCRRVVRSQDPEFLFDREIGNRPIMAEVAIIGLVEPGALTALVPKHRAARHPGWGWLTADQANDIGRYVEHAGPIPFAVSGNPVGSTIDLDQTR